MEVEAFRSTMKLDLNSWPLPWREIDHLIAKENGFDSFDEFLLHSQENKTNNQLIATTAYSWPSKQLNEDTVRTDLQEIWDTFISEEKATLQICLPNSVLRTTKFRFDHFQRFLFLLPLPCTSPPLHLPPLPPL
jgi:hypothetical protein